MSLYLALLRVQARLMGGALVGIAIAIGLAFATPWLVDVLGIGTPGDATPAQLFLRRGPIAGGVLLLAAIALGAMAGHTWAEEGSRNKGVYLMCLPLERWHLLLLEFAVAATFVLGGAALTFVGGVVTAAVAPIPDGLRAYPGALAARFLSMALLLMSVSFGPSRLAQQSDPQKVRNVALGMLGLLIALIAAEGLGYHVVSRVVSWLFLPGGPLHVVIGSWMLVDL